MKTAKRSIASLLVMVLLMGLFAVLPAATVSAETAVGTTYELYDYFKVLKDDFDNGTSTENGTPWSLQYKKNGGEWKDSFNTSSRSVDGANWIYRYDNTATFGYGTDAPWGGYAPGFAFEYQADYTSGRYQRALAIPTNSKWDAEDIAWRYDVAYAFTAPQGGYYSIGKADQDLVISWDDANYFAQWSKDEQLDFGVRITVDGNPVWPASDYAYYQDGWAVFGSNSAATDKIEVPSVENIRVEEGSVLRVELTSLTGGGAPYTQRLKGMFSVKYAKPLPVQAELPENLPVRYEIYDYYNDLVAGKTPTTPWSLEMHTNDGWVLPNSHNPEGEYTYVFNNAYGWYYPGFAFYNRTDITRNWASVATPVNNPNFASDLKQWNTAYTFTTPFTGLYTIGQANRDKVAAFDITDYFLPMDGSATGLEFGVRITVDDNTIWPLESHPDYYQGFARFGKGIEGVSEKVAVPTISNLLLEKESIVRVEFTTFTETTTSYLCRLYGMVGIQLDALEGTAPADIKEWENAGLYCDEVGNVNTTFESYSGDVIYNKGITTNADQGIALKVKAPSGLGNGIDLSINGFALHLQGANSTIGGSAIEVPVSEDNVYDIVYKVETMFGNNEVTGTKLTAIINGAIFALDVTDITAATSEGIVITNNSGTDDIIFTAGDLRLNYGAQVKYYDEYKLIYVETTDVAAIKSQIAGGDLYTFMSVGTGYTVTRCGETFTLALKNDVNSDCNVDSRDIVRLKKNLALAVELDTAQKFAATGYAFDPELADLVTLRENMLNG